MANRKYNIVVYGATGFTGNLVAKYFARLAQVKNLTWTIAGRSLAKLNRVKKELVAINAECSSIEPIISNSTEEQTLKSLVAQTDIIISLVGPYDKYGEPLVKACVEEGTHYLDITGEPAFVKRMVMKYHEAAESKGVFIINSCGFDSIPADLGAYYTAGQFEDEPISVQGFVKSKGNFSGGTWASAIEAMSRKPETNNGDDGGNKEQDNWIDKLMNVDFQEVLKYNNDLKRWTLPMPVIDPWMVKRSSEALTSYYGNGFKYKQFLTLSSLPKSLGLMAGVGALFAASKFDPLKNILLNFKLSGEGPSEEERANSFFELTFLAKSPSKRIITKVSGGDPGYSETSKMVSEAALTLLIHKNELPLKGGVLTPASALGIFLVERLHQNGINFEVIEEEIFSE